MKVTEIYDRQPEVKAIPIEKGMRKKYGSDFVIYTHDFYMKEHYSKRSRFKEITYCDRCEKWKTGKCPFTITSPEGQPLAWPVKDFWCEKGYKDPVASYVKGTKNDA